MSLLIIVVTFESEGGPPQGARDAVPRDETSRMPALPELKMPDFVDASLSYEDMGECSFCLVCLGVSPSPRIRCLSACRYLELTFLLV